MANRILSADEQLKAAELLTFIRSSLDELSAGDRELLFAYRRKVAKELTYDERSGPMERRRLKSHKRKEQAGLCAICHSQLPERYTVLDRLNAVGGYTGANTRLLCESCDRKVQAERCFT